MTSESILEQLFLSDKVVKEVELIKNKLTVVLKSLTAEAQLAVEKDMHEVKGSSPYILHIYSLKLLSQTLQSYGSKTFETVEEAYNFLSKLPSIIIDRLAKEHNELEKEIKSAITVENLEKTFFQEGSTPKEPEQ